MGPQQTLMNDSTPVSTLEASAGKGFKEMPRARVVRSVKEWISEGVIMPGQPLPAERELAQNLGVTRNTVRRALEMLDAEGVLRSQNGRARIVQDTKARGGLLENAIAVVTTASDQPWVGHRQSGWSEYIAHGVLHAARQTGMHAVALQPQRLADRDIYRLIAERPCGVIFTDVKEWTDQALQWAQALQHAGLPVVLYGDQHDSLYDRVNSDHESGAYQLARWLLEAGRCRPLLVWPSPPLGYWFARRRAGYERAVREAGLESLTPLTTTLLDVEFIGRQEFEESVRHLSEALKPYFSGKTPVDALMASSDSDTFALAAACRLCGRKPGEDVLIVGYDNYWSDSTARQWESAVPAATIDKLNPRMGTALVELLLQRAHNQLPLAPQRRVIEPELVVLSGDIAGNSSLPR